MKKINNMKINKKKQNFKKLLFILKMVKTY